MNSGRDGGEIEEEVEGKETVLRRNVERIKVEIMERQRKRWRERDSTEEESRVKSNRECGEIEEMKSETVLEGNVEGREVEIYSGEIGK